jgi:hypothetical protein
MGWKTDELWFGYKFLSSPKHPDWLYSPPSLKFRRYQR